MEFLCKLLCFDDYKKLAEASSSQPMDTFSYTIRHKYPKRLVTYDAEELGERRLIRSSDLSQSLLSAMQPVCPKKDQVKDVISKCWQPIYPLDELTKGRLAQLEKCGKALHKSTVEELGPEHTESSNWDGLKPMQKLSFFWQALTGHKLRSTPYANFKQIIRRRYLKSRPQVCERRLRVLARRYWLCLSSKDRVPFNLQALLYHVSTGDVDPFDHCAVRVLLNRWR
ncbi:uncharacterized protein LOC6569723 [Drosophila grimshawi]|uniref:GH14102 n=1 Tax=Drosophila grimshawi TaxID=7222 RepID=B4JY20_DROGR|nr:uncharacterized protein LOC6569723 [Drosophila grimshawi]XP_032597605.1 uncharacterized protein LOC6569723 [Drosophila grimshawi]EDV90582.1 GH14102 [Drosophila grimshawi]